MGAALGISKNYVYMLEAGTKNPSRKILDKLDQMEASESNRKAEPDFVAENAMPYRCKECVRSWLDASTEELEELLTEFAQVADLGAVREITNELLHRKITEKLKGRTT